MATRFASRGYLRIGASVVTKAMDISVELDANSEDVVLNSGESGSTRGTKTVKVTCDSAVPIGDAERYRILKAFENDDFVTVVYKSAGTTVSSEGTLKTCSLSSGPQKADKFSFAFGGTLGPIQRS